MLKKFTDCLSKEYTHVEDAASYCLERDGGTVNVYFQWSNGKVDWKNNFDFPAKPYREMEDAWYCHRGFLRVWKAIEPYIACELCSISTNKINIVGYSHGGAIAQLCYEYVAFNRPDIFEAGNLTGVGFGAPRVVWGNPNSKVRSRFDGFIIVRNGRDIVTHMPPRFFGFTDICEIMQIGEAGSGKNFFNEVKEKGFWIAVMDGNYLGSVMDHFEHNYIESLTELEKNAESLLRPAD